MKIYLLIILVVLFLILCFNKEDFWVTNTYVNTPTQYGAYPTTVGSPWGGNYYQRLKWTPFGYHNSNNKYNPLPITSVTANNPGYIHYTPPYHNLPLNNNSPNRMFGPMLTNVDNPKNYLLGEWVHAGTGHTKNPNDNVIIDVFQLNLDPKRDLYKYKAVNKHGQTLNMNIHPHIDVLENNDRFTVSGMKDVFIFEEDDRYVNVFV